MSLIDWLIIGIYLVYIIYTGVRISTQNKGVEDYFLANRSLPWWAVGLSVMATQMSAITLVGTTGQAFVDGMRFIQFYFGLPLAMVLLCVTVVPFFYRARVYTAYEYLEKRFDARTRSLTSFLFLLSRGLSCGVIIAAPSVILSIVLGWNEITTILVMGLATTIYTMFGGVKAVTWTDVKQMVVIFVGLGACLWVLLSQLPDTLSFGNALSLAAVTGRLQTIDTSFSLKETYTLWSGLIGGLFLMLSYFGCDQSQVQRFLTARSLHEGRTSLLFNAFVKIPVQFVILLIGVLVFVFYHFSQPPMIFNTEEEAKVKNSPYAGQYEHLQTEYGLAFIERRDAATAFAAKTSEPELKQKYEAAEQKLTGIRAEGINLIRQANNGAAFTDVNYIFPTFITRHMPVGFVGLMIAAIFAAAMSSIAAELNALSTATVIDFYRRHFRPEADDTHYLRISKIATGFWGVFACIVAMYAGTLGSLIEVVNKFGSFFYGSLLGVFVLAIGTKWATARGAFWGLLAGISTVAFVNYFGEIAAFLNSGVLLSIAPALQMSFLWYNLVGCVAVVGVGLVISMMDRAGRAAVSGKR
jgi:SSS family solute:Na+ symporter